MKSFRGEPLISIPGGVGVNNTDRESFDPRDKVYDAYNVDDRNDHRWTKRFPIQPVPCGGGTDDLDWGLPIVGIYQLIKENGDTYDIVVLSSGQIWVQYYSSGTSQGFANLGTRLAGDFVQAVTFRDRLLLCNGISDLQYVLDRGAAGYTENTNFGNAGVFPPLGIPYVDTYGESTIKYTTYDQYDGGILGPPGCGLIEYKHLFEFDDGVLYGNPGAAGRHAHAYSVFDGTPAENIGNPLIEFQWFNKFQIEGIVGGEFTAEAAANAMVSKRVIAARHKAYADQPFGPLQRTGVKVGGAITSVTELWSDAATRTGIQAEINNDEPAKFKYMAKIGGDVGVILGANQKAGRDIPYPIDISDSYWGTPDYRNPIEITNNSTNTFTRPTVRIVVDVTDIQGSRTMSTHYGDFVFADADGRTVLDSYVDPFTSPSSTSIAFIVTPQELVAGQTITIYLYYNQATPKLAALYYGSWSNVHHPRYAYSQDVFHTLSDERVWPPLSGSTDAGLSIRNKVGVYDGDFVDWTIQTGPFAMTATIYNSTATRPYGLVSTQVQGGGTYAPRLDNISGDSIWMLYEGALDNDPMPQDVIGRELESFHIGFWFKRDPTVAFTNAKEYSLYGHYGRDANEDFRVLYVRGPAGATGSVIRVLSEYREGVGNTTDITVDDYLDSSDWVFFGLSWDSGYLNTVIMKVSSATPATNLANVITDRANVGGSAYKYNASSETGIWIIGRINRSATADYDSFPMYLGPVHITEGAAQIGDMLMESMDRTSHGCADSPTMTSNASIQPELAISIGDSEQLSDVGAHEKRIGWSKLGQEVFPLEYEQDLDHVCKGVIEWQDDGIVFTNNSINMVASTPRPGEWRVIENIGQENGILGLLADKCLFKTEDSMIFYSQRGLYAYDVDSTPVKIDSDIWEYIKRNYTTTQLRNTVGFYWPKYGRIFITFLKSSDRETWTMNWHKYRRTGRTDWHRYECQADGQFPTRFGHTRSADKDNDELWMSYGDTTANNYSIVEFDEDILASFGGVYKDEIYVAGESPAGSGNTLRVITWEIESGDILVDGADLTGIDINMDQYQLDGSQTAEDPPIADITVVRDGKTESFADVKIYRHEDVQPRPDVCEYARIKIGSDSKNDPTDQSVVRNVQAKFKPFER